MNMMDLRYIDRYRKIYIRLYRQILGYVYRQRDKYQVDMYEYIRKHLNLYSIVQARMKL